MLTLVREIRLRRERIWIRKLRVDPELSLLSSLMINSQLSGGGVRISGTAVVSMGDEKGIA